MVIGQKLKNVKGEPIIVLPVFKKGCSGCFIEAGSYHALILIEELWIQDRYEKSGIV